MIDNNNYQSVLRKKLRDLKKNIDYTDKKPVSCSSNLTIFCLWGEMDPSEVEITSEN